MLTITKKIDKARALQRYIKILILNCKYWRYRAKTLLTRVHICFLKQCNYMLKTQQVYGMMEKITPNPIM